MKKLFIVSLLICILTLGTAGINAKAANGFSYNDMLGFLNSINITNEINEEKSNQEISRIEFAVMAAKMIGVSEAEPPEVDYFNDIKSDHWGKFSVNALVESKIVFGDGERNFRPNDIITLPEASVMLIRMMNLEYEAEQCGGYPHGYINTATRHEVISSSVSKGNLTYKDAVILIFNALNATITDNNNDDETLLSIYHEIQYDEGQLTSVCGASVNEEMACAMDKISIDGEVFDTKTKWLYDRLGVYVKYYYICGRDGSKTVVYVSGDNDAKNEVIEITSDCYIGFNNGKVEYYKESDDEKKLNKDIYNGVVVIRNGQNVSYDLNAAFADFYGYMRLIKTKGHDDFDVVIIEDYKNIVVGAIDSEEKIIYDKENNSSSIQLSQDDYEVISYVDMEGNECSFDKIGVGDVISVAKSSDGKFAKIIIISDEISGFVKSKRYSDGSMFIEIDGKEYEFESLYYETKMPSIVFEEKVTIKTDLFGKIASYEIPKVESYKFAYLIRAFKDDELYAEERVLIKMFTEDGEMLTVGCATEILIDLQRYSDNNSIIGALSYGDEVKSQLIRFKCNSKNDIVSIDTTNDANDPEKSLHLMDAEKNLYRHWTNLVGYNAYVPTSVKVMVVPEEGSEKTASADQFQIKNITAVPSGKASRIDLYQIDENSLDVDFVVYYNNIQSSIDTYAALYVVEKKLTGLNYDDEPALVLQLNSTGNSVNYAIAPKYEISDDDYKNLDPELLDRGDVIRIATDHKNEITSIQLVLDYSKAKEDGDDNFFTNALNPAFKAVNNVAVGNFFDGFKMSYGYVSRTSGNLIQWGYNEPGTANEIYNITFDSNKAKILVFDEDTVNSPCRAGTVSDIVGYYTSTENYSKLIAVSRSAIISNMIIFK